MTHPGFLPDTTATLTAPFWAAAREERLVAQRCANCGRFRWNPAEVCPECLSTEAAWTDLSGTATVWSFVVYRRAMHSAFVGAVPYTAAMLELPEGIRMLGSVVTTTGDADRDGELRIGDRVEVRFERVDADLTLVRWVPAHPPRPEAGDDE